MVHSSQAAAPTTYPAAVASNAFAVDLYAQLHSKAGNLCVSPYSISSALDMTSAGAGGETARQMLSTLHWTEPRDGLADAAQLLAASLRVLDIPAESGPQMQIANALFAQSGFSFRQDFLDIASKKFDGSLQKVDFINHAQQAVHDINHWVAGQTHNRINQAIPLSAITPLTRLILINAIYFKAKWETEFRKPATSDEQFLVDGKSPMKVPLMQKRDSLNYFQNDALQVMEMPYQGDFSMIVVLPRKPDGLPAIEQSLSGDKLLDWLGNLRPQLLQVFIPRFKIQGSFSLKEPLLAMGMTDAFSRNKADFSQMASEPLNIDDVIHKTFISVDEAGTEAAAMTAAVMRAGAMVHRNPEQPIEFRADHPFLYLLRHRSTGTILFMGRVVDPR